MSVDFAVVVALGSLISSIQIGIGVWVVRSNHKMEIAVTRYGERFKKLESDMKGIDDDVRSVSNRVDNWIVVVNGGRPKRASRKVREHENITE